MSPKGFAWLVAVRCLLATVPLVQGSSGSQLQQQRWLPISAAPQGGFPSFGSPDPSSLPPLPAVHCMLHQPAALRPGPHAGTSFLFCPLPAAPLIMGNGRNLIDMVCEAFESDAEPGTGLDGGGSCGGSQEEDGEELFNFSEWRPSCWKTAACQNDWAERAIHRVIERGYQGPVYLDTTCPVGSEPACAHLVLTRSLVAFPYGPCPPTAFAPPARHLPCAAAPEEGRVGQRCHGSLLRQQFLRGAQRHRVFRTRPPIDLPATLSMDDPFAMLGLPGMLQEMPCKRASAAQICPIAGAVCGHAGWIPAGGALPPPHAGVVGTGAGWEATGVGARSALGHPLLKGS